MDKEKIKNAIMQRKDPIGFLLQKISIKDIEERKNLDKSINAFFDSALKEIKDNFLYEAIKDLNSKTDDLNKSNIASLESTLLSLREKCLDYIKNSVESKLSTILKGDKGDKGEDGYSPNVSSIIKEAVKQVESKIKIPKNGEDGEDGSPDTPDMVINKVNLSDKKIKASRIEGFFEEIKSLKDLFKKSQAYKTKPSGGMGLPIHETFNISTGTISVTTEYPIAGNGNAIFKSNYEGSGMDKDIHFTVGADRKTINFNSTVQAQFADGTTFSITYIRG